MPAMGSVESPPAPIAVTSSARSFHCMSSSIVVCGGANYSNWRYHARMGEERKSIYDDLKRDLRGFAVEEFVREFAKAYFEGDMETIRKLQGLLTSLSPETEAGEGHSGPAAPDAPVGVPRKPRPHVNSGAVAVPEPE